MNENYWKYLVEWIFLIWNSQIKAISEQFTFFDLLKFFSDMEYDYVEKNKNLMTFNECLEIPYELFVIINLEVSKQIYELKSKILCRVKSSENKLND